MNCTMLCSSQSTCRITAVKGSPMAKGRSLTAQLRHASRPASGGGRVRARVKTKTLRSLVMGMLCLAALGVFPQLAHAQARELNPDILIDALAEEGMSELLVHMVETEPLDDPITARQVKIAQYRILYHDTNRDLAARYEALDSAIDSTRKLIKDFPDHFERPIWQTDLAELLLVEFLQVRHNQAGLFYEFGIPTPEQRDAYEHAVVEALEATSSARLRLFQLRGAGGLGQERVNELKRSGVFSRLFEEYGEQRTPYFYAQAAYRVALLPDSNPYFANLGQRANPDIPQQAKTPKDERARLLTQAVDDLQKLIDANDVGIGVIELAQTEVARRTAFSKGKSVKASLRSTN